MSRVEQVGRAQEGEGGRTPQNSNSFCPARFLPARPPSPWLLPQLAAMSQQFRNAPATFPGLPVREIVDSCRSYGCPMSEEDVLHPTASRAQAIYGWWMSTLLGLNMEDIIRAADQQMDHMEVSVSPQRVEEGRELMRNICCSGHLSRGDVHWSL